MVLPPAVASGVPSGRTTMGVPPSPAAGGSASGASSPEEGFAGASASPGAPASPPEGGSSPAASAAPVWGSWSVWARAGMAHSGSAKASASSSAIHCFLIWSSFNMYGSPARLRERLRFLGAALVVHLPPGGMSRESSRVPRNLQAAVLDNLQLGRQFLPVEGPVLRAEHGVHTGAA